MIQFPSTKSEYIKRIATETAKMSYPGRMGGILKEGAKKDVIEEYFKNDFPLVKIWDNPKEVADFDKWHKERVQEFSDKIKLQNCLHDEYKGDEVAVAAKLLNTFLHQLMKYEECHYLWANLHLPLDSIVLKKLREISKLPEYEKYFSNVEDVIDKKPYSIKYDQYIKIQKALKELVEHINRQARGEYKLKSRIELNALLWVEPKRRNID